MGDEVPFNWRYFTRFPGALKPILLTLHLILLIFLLYAASHFVVWMTWVLAVSCTFVASLLQLFNKWDTVLTGRLPFIVECGVSALLFLLYIVSFVFAIIDTITAERWIAAFVMPMILLALLLIGLNIFVHVRDYLKHTGGGTGWMPRPRQREPSVSARQPGQLDVDESRRVVTVASVIALS